MEGHDGRKMDTIKNDIREELKEVALDGWADTYEEFETDFEEYLQNRYNTHPMTKYECVAIVGNDLQLYLEMEEEANAYWYEITGEEYTKSGMVNIVPLWLLSFAEKWKNDELENIYEELTRDEEITRDPLTIQQ